MATDSESQIKTVLVTGGSGFLGSWCLVELLRRGYRVRTTVRNLAQEPALRAALASEVEAGERLSVLAAELGSEEGWGDAAEGCDYVLHVASPFPPVQPKDPEALIATAREGTLRVLRASMDAGVGRVVMTSSVAALAAGHEPSSVALTEEQWTDPDHPGLTPYVRSKTLAERAAWQFMGERGEVEKLAVVNPGAILGPTMSADCSYSLEIIERLLRGMPGAPRFGFSIVDVRDVADLQLRAMSAPEAGGERLIASTEFMWMSEVAEVLRERLGKAAARAPKRTVPNLLVRGASIFDRGIRPFVRELGTRVEVSNEKARILLGWSPRPVPETIVECAQSLIDQGVVKGRRAGGGSR